ncbi:hypothetical protein DRP04_08080 [Archaeoglobales archaeon]|mgnify:CR=1 FL=1|nr:MAG: hypothetical protein DRP04_08080 [Archaeoglobales archaeon]
MEEISVEKETYVQKVLKKSNEYWKTVINMKKTLNELKEEWRREFPEVDEWELPFREFRLEDWISTTRTLLCDFVISEVMRASELRNIHADHNELVSILNEKIGKENFDAFELYNIIREHYFRDPDREAWEQLLHEARRLVPYGVLDKETGEWRKVRPEDIANGDVLVLQHFINDYCYSKSEFTVCFEALEKVIRVLTGIDKPSRVMAPFADTEFWDMANWSDEAIFTKHNSVVEPIRWVRIYKNGKVKVKLTSAELAMKVARALLGELGTLEGI